jgi:hypothetical protein
MDVGPIVGDPIEHAKHLLARPRVPCDFAREQSTQPSVLTWPVNISKTDKTCPTWPISVVNGIGHLTAQVVHFLLQLYTLVGIHRRGTKAR